jgi:hypothetical protein
MGSSGRSYWRPVPLRRLKFLLLGVFCLVGMVGCLLDLIVLGEKPFVEVFGWTVFTGIMAVVYLLFGIRAPRLIVFLVALHYLLSQPFSKLLRFLNAGAPAPPTELGVRVAAIGSLVLCLLACVFFLLFFYSEGRTSIRLQTELALAHGIQHTLVPIVHTRSRLWEIYGVSLPSEQVGGDLVDLVQEQDGSALAYVADISGHGLQAGILMGMFKTAARTCIVESPSLSTLMERINRVLPQVKEPEMYATCAAVRITRGVDHATCELDLANAGHPPILRFSATDKKVFPFPSNAPPLGLMPEPEFLSHTVKACAGDLLLIATDGVTEVCDATDQEFGIERLQSLLIEQHHKRLQVIAAEILDAAARWGKQMDDQTLLLVRFSSESCAAPGSA